MSHRTTSLPASVLVLPHSAKGGAAAASRRRRHGTLGDEPGVLIVPHQIGNRAITKAQLAQAAAALRELPAADVALVAAHHIQIHLYPVSGLEDGLLGATTIVQGDGAVWMPTKIRVAAQANLQGSESLPEIVQHEFGHAVSVLRHQDRSEAAAIQYAASH